MATIEKRKYVWLVRWTEGGKRVSRTFGDEETALAFRAEKNAIPAKYWRPDLMSTKKVGTAQPLAAYALATLGPELKDTTQLGYERTIRKHLSQTAVGRTPVDAITPSMVREFWNGLDADKGARRNIHKVLARAFAAAEREGLIAFSPMRRAGVRSPARDGAEIVPLTVADIEALADAANSQRDRLAILVMAFAGLRAGEVGGLRVGDIDFRWGRINVRQALSYDRQGRPIFGQPKTRAGRRSVPCERGVVREIEGWVNERGLHDDDLLFQTVQRTPLGPRLLQRQVGIAARKAGLAHVHPHQLRHSAASLWIDGGANPREVQMALGHANIKETLGTYAHLFAGADQGLADSMTQRRAAHRSGGRFADRLLIPRLP